MSQTVTLRSVPPALPANVNLASLLAVLKKMQQLVEPLATADGLRQAIQLLVQLGTVAGSNSAWISQLQNLLADSGAFNTVLSIIAYFESLSTNKTDSTHPASELGIDAGSLANLLPLVIQILQLIQSIRGSS